MAKHIAGVAQFAFVLQGSLLISVQLPFLSPGGPSSPLVLVITDFVMGVVSSCCESCCMWLFSCGFTIRRLAPILTTPFSPLAEVDVRAVVVGERAGGSC